MKKNNRNNHSSPDPYEDIIRLEKLDPYETLIQQSAIPKQKKE